MKFNEAEEKLKVIAGLGRRYTMSFDKEVCPAKNTIETHCYLSVGEIDDGNVMNHYAVEADTWAAALEELIDQMQSPRPIEETPDVEDRP